MIKVTLVNADDWQGLYFNDELQYENHIISAKEALEIVSCIKEPFDFETVYVDEDWLYELGTFPGKLSEVVLSNIY